MVKPLQVLSLRLYPPPFVLLTAIDHSEVPADALTLMKLINHFFSMWGTLFSAFLSLLLLFLLWRSSLSILLLDQCSFSCAEPGPWIRGTHVRMPNYQLAIKEAHSHRDIIIQLWETLKSHLSLMLASPATSKWLEFICYHFTLMSALLDHSPILWGKPKESLFAFQSHLLFLWL